MVGVGLTEVAACRPGLASVTDGQANTGGICDSSESTPPKNAPAEATVPGATPDQPSSSVTPESPTVTVPAMPAESRLEGQEAAELDKARLLSELVEFILDPSKQQQAEDSLQKEVQSVQHRVREAILPQPVQRRLSRLSPDLFTTSQEQTQIVEERAKNVFLGTVCEQAVRQWDSHDGQLSALRRILRFAPSNRTDILKLVCELRVKGSQAEELAVVACMLQDAGPREKEAIYDTVLETGLKRDSHPFLKEFLVAHTGSDGAPTKTRHDVLARIARECPFTTKALWARRQNECAGTGLRRYLPLTLVAALERGDIATCKWYASLQDHDLCEVALPFSGLPSESLTWLESSLSPVLQAAYKNAVAEHHELLFGSSFDQKAANLSCREAQHVLRAKLPSDPEAHGKVITRWLLEGRVDLAELLIKELRYQGSVLEAVFASGQPEALRLVTTSHLPAEIATTYLRGQWRNLVPDPGPHFYRAARAMAEAVLSCPALQTAFSRTQRRSILVNNEGSYDLLGAGKPTSDTPAAEREADAQVTGKLLGHLRKNLDGRQTAPIPDVELIDQWLAEGLIDAVRDLWRNLGFVAGDKSTADRVGRLQALAFTLEDETLHLHLQQNLNRGDQKQNLQYLRPMLLDTLRNATVHCKPKVMLERMLAVINALCGRNWKTQMGTEKVAWALIGNSKAGIVEAWLDVLDLQQPPLPLPALHYTEEKDCIDLFMRLDDAVAARLIEKLEAPEEVYGDLLVRAAAAQTQRIECAAAAAQRLSKLAKRPSWRQTAGTVLSYVPGLSSQSS